MSFRYSGTVADIVTLPNLQNNYQTVVAKTKRQIVQRMKLEPMSVKELPVESCEVH
jgi:hypothetical protein